MAEVLRDLVVSLSLKSDNFARNITSINKQIKEAESAFNLAGAGVDKFGSTTAGMNSRLTLLQSTLGHQKEAVNQYERALEVANQRLQDSHSRQEQYTQRLTDTETALDESRQKHEELGKAISDQTQYLKQIEELCGKDCDAYRAEADVLDSLKDKYKTNSQEVSALEEQYKKLQGQLGALQKATQNAANASIQAQTNLNNAKAAVKATEAEIAKLEKRLRAANSGWTTAGTAMTNFSKKLSAIGKAAASVGKQLSLYVTTPLVALGKNAIDATVDFESSFTSVRKTVDATEEEFAALAEASKQMSTQIAASTTEINEVMATGGQLGIANEHLTEFTRVMIDLGNSCEDLDANNAATQLAKLANIMGTDQSLFKNMGSTIVDLGNNFATTEGPIAEMAMRLAGAGKQIGLTEPQVLGLAAALSSVGIQAQMGGSAMSKALIKMEVAAKTGGDALTDFATVCKMSEQEFVEAWSNDPVAVFQRFISCVAELNDEGISAVQTLDEMGIKEIRLRDTLLRATNANELFADAQERANRAWKENTALETEANKRYATLESRLTNLKNKAGLFAQTLGNDLRPTIDKVMSAVSDFIDKLMDMDEGQRQTILRWAAIAAAAGPVLVIFGKLSTGISKVIGYLGSFCTAVGNAGGGLSGLLSVLAKSPAVWIAVGVAVVAGIAHLYDWASGAKAAREAQEKLNDAVEKWGENVTTAYERSKGLSAFGLTAEDFTLGGEVGAGTGSDWLSQTIATWTDGKKETDEIVAETVKSFTDGTESIRTSLESLKESAGGTVIGDLDGDLETLDAIDAEVESILKKKQNGFLSDEETDRLQELMDQRDAIRIKYRLVEDTEGAFGEIVQGVEAALSRGADGAATFSDAFAAATQGIGAFTTSLNEEYDARYKVISAMEEGAEKEQAYAELRAWYDQQALAAQNQYYAALIRTAEQTGVFAQGGEFAATADKLREINGLLAEAAGKDSMSAEMNALREALAGLDETAIVELDSAIAAMESAAAAAGESVPEDVLAAKQALEDVKNAATSTSNVLSDDVATAFSTMFDGLSTESHEVYASLNCDNLTTAYDAWAAGEHTPIIPTLDTESIAEIDLTGNITNVLKKEGATFSVDTNGNITGVTWPEGTTFETDVKGNITSATTPEGTTYTIDAKGNITSLSRPEGTTLTVDTTGRVTSVTTPENVKFSVDTSGHVTSITTIGDDGKPFTVDCMGSINGVTWPEGSEFSTDVNGNITGVTTPDGVTYSIDTAGQITTVTTAAGVTYTVDGGGRITAVSLDPKAVLPTVNLNATATVSKVNFEEGVFSDSERPDLEYTAAQTRTTKGFLGITDFAAPAMYDDLHRAAEAVREYNAAVESGNTEGQLAWLDSVQSLSSVLGDNLGADSGLGFQTMAQYIANGMQLLSEGSLTPEQAEQYKQAIEDIVTVLDNDVSSAAAAGTELGTSMQEGLSDALNAEGWETAGDTVMGQIEAGFVSAADRARQLGDDISAGIGEGQSTHEFSGDAETTIANDETALRTAAQSNSPAARFNPLGKDISAGIGQGMTQYSFAANSSATITSLVRSLSASIVTHRSSVQTSAKGIGSAITTGIVAGINAGKSSVITAAVQAAQAAITAAKQALGIRSPSRVFRDEVGLMAMKGLGEGFIQGEKEQAKIIQNASRYLTEASKNGIVAGNQYTENKKYYSQDSSVSLSGNNFYVRDEIDVQSLAIEIASLTKAKQRGSGFRYA